MKVRYIDQTDVTMTLWCEGAREIDQRYARCKEFDLSVLWLHPKASRSLESWQGFEIENGRLTL